MAIASRQRQINEAPKIQAERRLPAALPVTPSDLAEYERYQTVVRRAISVFGDEITASRWLSTPSPDFNGEAPIQLAQKNGYSLKQLEPVFVRIEHGIDF
jgi:uncharacterized protein (DUF2384 family)